MWKATIERAHWPIRKLVPSLPRWAEFGANHDIKSEISQNHHRDGPGRGRITVYCYSHSSRYAKELITEGYVFP